MNLFKTNLFRSAVQGGNTLIDCTLSNLEIPGFSDFVPQFGTKKQDSQPITARENNRNIMLSFSRPFIVSEYYDTTTVQIYTRLSSILPTLRLRLVPAVLTAAKSKR
jgi:hypothetical protein